MTYIPKGIIVPMVTPFTRDLQVDEDGLRWLVGFLENNGVHGLFPASTTGEFVHLSRDERDSVVEIVVDEHTRAKVLPGISANATDEAVSMGRKYVDLGVDGVVVTPPYYFKPRKEGLFKHFSTIAEKVDTTIVIYNIPSTTGITIPVELVSELAVEHSNIVAMKITYSNFTYLRQAILSLKNASPRFSILTGMADMLLPNLMAGGDGGIVALANFHPKLLVGLYETYVRGDINASITLWRRILELSRLYDLAETPVVVKQAINLVYGKIQPYTRPPLLPLPPEKTSVLEEILKDQGLIPA